MVGRRVLILGHSFIRRLRDFIEKRPTDYDLNFGLKDSLSVHWQGVGGRTVPKLVKFDLNVVRQVQPDIVFLQVGTNDLTVKGMTPLTVGSAIEDLVRLLHDSYGVKLVCVGQTIKRRPVSNFNNKVQLLAQYLKTVLEPIPYAIYWSHRGFWRNASCYLSYDGVHLNGEGHHKLYKSIRGAIIHSLKRIDGS